MAGSPLSVSSEEKYFVETKELVQSDNSMDFETANMAQAVEIDGKIQPAEYYLNGMFQNDYASLMGCLYVLKFSVKLRELTFVAWFYGVSPIIVEEWWSVDIGRYYTEGVKLHNEVNKVED